MMLSPESETRGAYGLGYKMLPIAEGVRMVGHDGARPIPG
jgi:hypothetical protein